MNVVGEPALCYGVSAACCGAAVKRESGPPSLSLLDIDSPSLRRSFCRVRTAWHVLLVAFQYVFSYTFEIPTYSSPESIPVDDLRDAFANSTESHALKKNAYYLPGQKGNCLPTLRSQMVSVDDLRSLLEPGHEFLENLDPTIREIRADQLPLAGTQMQLDHPRVFDAREFFTALTHIATVLRKNPVYHDSAFEFEGVSNGFREAVMKGAVPEICFSKHDITAGDKAYEAGHPIWMQDCKECHARMRTINDNESNITFKVHEHRDDYLNVTRGQISPSSDGLPEMHLLFVAAAFMYRMFAARRRV